MLEKIRQRESSARVFSVILLLFVVTLGFLGWVAFKIQETAILSSVDQGCEVLSLCLSKFRALYTKEVVNRVTPLGIQATHAYAVTARAIPLPATLTIELGKAIDESGGAVTVRLYSRYPFPWRKAEGGPRDRFEKDAIDFLEKHPEEKYSGLDTVNGQSVYRYATADIMRPACIQCHNTHPQSPKTDWKEGDVRGILEITREMAPIEKRAQGTLTGIYMAFGGAILTLFVLLCSIVAYVRRTVDTEQVRELTGVVNELVSHANMLYASASQLSTTSAETLATVTETTTIVEQTRQIAEGTSARASSVSKDTQAVSQSCQVGQQAAQETVEGMTRIHEQMRLIGGSMEKLVQQTQTIGEIIASVDEIAHYSSLLAVNAAVEAAKAGEAGRGFSVVAQEVKALAQQSKACTANVRQALNAIAQSTSQATASTEQGSNVVKHGSALVEQVRQAITQLLQNVDRTVRSARQIESQGEQQMVAMQQVLTAMELLKSSSEQSVDNARDLERAAGELNSLGARLKNMMARYEHRRPASTESASPSKKP